MYLITFPYSEHRQNATLCAGTLENVFALVCILERTGEVKHYKVLADYGQAVPSDFGWGDLPKWKPQTR